MMLERKEYKNAHNWFEAAVEAGYIYSTVLQGPGTNAYTSIMPDALCYLGIDPFRLFTAKLRLPISDHRRTC